MKNSGSSCVVFVDKNDKPLGIITEKDIIRFLAKSIDFEEKALNYANKKVVKICEDTNIFYAIFLMIENNVEVVIVVNKEGKFSGVIEKKNVFFHFDKDYFRLEAKVKELIEKKKDFHYLNERATLKDAIKLFVEHNIEALVILNKNNKPVVIVTQRDFINIPIEKFDEPIISFVNNPVITVKEDDPITLPIEIFKKYKINYVLVANKKEEIISLISEKDYDDIFIQNYSEIQSISLNFLKKFFSEFPEAIIEVVEDKDKNRYYISWANKEALSIFQEKELVGKDITDFFDDKTWFALLIGLKTKSIHKQVIKLTFLNKTCEVTGKIINTLEGNDIIQLFLKDITEVEIQREEIFNELYFLKNTLNNCFDSVFIINPLDGKFVLANDTFLELLGYSDKDLKNLTIYDVITISKTIFEKYIKTILTGKLKNIRKIFYFKTKWGEYVPLEIKAKVINYKDNVYILINGYKVERYFQLKNKLTNFYLFFYYINYLSLVSNETEAFNILEKFLLKFVDGFCYYEVDPEERKVKKELSAGKYYLWKNCLENLNSCIVFKHGRPFKKQKDLACLSNKNKDLVHICYPIFIEGGIKGIICCFSQKPLDSICIEFLERYIQIFNIYLSNIKFYSLIKELAIKDYLTGLYNRRHIYEILNREFYRWKRNKIPFSIILADLDDFKKVNDAYGHLAGDKVLKEISQIFLDNLREIDYVGRIGGEEFLIVLPETSKSQAFLIAERLRKKISTTPINIDDVLKIHITVSCGIAECPSDGENIEKLYSVADMRMYKAKSYGKNLVVSD